MAKETIKGKIVKEYLAQYPDMPDLTLAKLIHQENKLHFASPEKARDIVRLYTGHVGEKKLKSVKDKRFIKPITYNTTPFKSPKSEAQELQIFKLPKDRKSILFLTDIHLPHHDEKALDIAINYGIKEKVDTIWLNGDIMDMYQASSHEKSPSVSGINFEFDMCRNFLKQLRELFPKAGIYYKEGNHETRWKRLLLRQAPMIFGIEEFELPILLRFSEYKVHWIPNETLVKFGKLNVIHGNEFKGGGGVNPARSLYLRAKDNVIAGDKHKSGENTEGSLNGNIVTTWSVGALCQLNPAYLPFTHVNWNAGFAHITMNNEDFHVRNYRIWNNKIL